MHGLVFVTWEKYIKERFGSSLLQTYRDAIGETAATSPLANRVYDDATLVAGLQAFSAISKVPANTLLREYGRYFITNGLTRHLCAYLLSRVNNGRDLLLAMRDGHQQMRRTPDGLTPPLFTYASIPSDPHGLILMYDSPRKLCPVLLGAIEGAAERYGEQVHVTEQTCMNQGAPVCRFEIHFRPTSQSQAEKNNTHWQDHRSQQQQLRQQMAEIISSFLPLQGGMTMANIQERLRIIPGFPPEQIRPHTVLEALRYLQYAGLVASSANEPGDILTQRRFWRVPTDQ
jgi:hypothetical protein